MKRIITMLLAIVILMGCAGVRVEAADSAIAQIDSKPLGMASIGLGGYKELSSSQELIDVIKVMEGFVAKATWDHQQYSIGYGSKATSSTQVVTPEEAEKMLTEQLVSYEKSVNSFCRKIGKQPTQNQFDALVSFTYNLGSGWMSGSRLAVWLKNPTTETELVNAMGQWVRASGQMLYSLAQRRIREAIIFLKGEYSIPRVPTPASDYNIRTNLRVISNGALPYYNVVIYQYGYSTSTVAAGNGNLIMYYPIGASCGEQPVPERDGYTFTGWKITRISNNKTNIGGMLNAGTLADKCLEVTAQWLPIAGSEPSDGEYTEHYFSDVNVTDWFFEDVMYVCNEGLMNGISDSKFGPSGKMTRGMLVTVLYRMDGSPKITQSQRNPFVDVSNEYFADAVAWGKANGIVTGVTEKEFRPNANVTREQAITIFYRYCVDYCGNKVNKTEKLSRFADAKKVSGYAVEPMKWAVAEGLISGSSEGKKVYLNPTGELIRCQAAAILRRYVEQILS